MKDVRRKRILYGSCILIILIAVFGLRLSIQRMDAIDSQELTTEQSTEQTSISYSDETKSKTKNDLYDDIETQSIKEIALGFSQQFFSFDMALFPYLKELADGTIVEKMEQDIQKNKEKKGDIISTSDPKVEKKGNEFQVTMTVNKRLENSQEQHYSIKMLMKKTGDTYQVIDYQWSVG